MLRDRMGELIYGRGGLCQPRQLGHDMYVEKVPDADAFVGVERNGSRPKLVDSNGRLPGNSRAVETRYDQRAYVFHGTVTAAAIRLQLRP